MESNKQISGNNFVMSTCEHLVVSLRLAYNRPTTTLLQRGQPLDENEIQVSRSINADILISFEPRDRLPAVHSVSPTGKSVFKVGDRAYVRRRRTLALWPEGRGRANRRKEGRRPTTTPMRRENDKKLAAVVEGRARRIVNRHDISI